MAGHYCGDDGVFKEFRLKVKTIGYVQGSGRTFRSMKRSKLCDPYRRHTAYTAGTWTILISLIGLVDVFVCNADEAWF